MSYNRLLIIAFALSCSSCKIDYNDEHPRIIEWHPRMLIPGATSTLFKSMVRSNETGKIYIFANNNKESSLVSKGTAAQGAATNTAQYGSIWEYDPIENITTEIHVGNSADELYRPKSAIIDSTGKHIFTCNKVYAESTDITTSGSKHTIIEYDITDDGIELSHTWVIPKEGTTTLKYQGCYRMVLLADNRSIIISNNMYPQSSTPPPATGISILFHVDSSMPVSEAKSLLKYSELDSTSDNATNTSPAFVALSSISNDTLILANSNSTKTSYYSIKLDGADVLSTHAMSNQPINPASATDTGKHYVIDIQKLSKYKMLALTLDRTSAATGCPQSAANTDQDEELCYGKCTAHVYNRTSNISFTDIEINDWGSGDDQSNYACYSLSVSPDNRIYYPFIHLKDDKINPIKRYAITI